MFENQSPQSSEPPSNLPLDDMLAGVEKESEPQVSTPPDALEAGVLKKKEPMSAPQSTPLYTPPAQQSQPPVSYSVKKPMLGKIFTFIIILVILGGIGFGGWWLYETYIKTGVLFGKKQPSTNGTDLPPSRELPLTPPPATSSVTTDISNDTILFGEQTDSDKDNLDDRREQELGTDSTKPDTDSDGLNDGDEVIIWRTNPLKPDSDDDGYKDGEEVKNGYNPIGPGKLLNPTTPSSSTSTSTPL